MNRPAHRLPILLLACAPAWATYSIVAVDSVTKEVGGAGASCLDDRSAPGGVLIISDVLPGKGVIHTQAQHDATNKANARKQMEGGASPQGVVDWLATHDVANNPGVRQYGVADLFQGKPRAAAYTGANCMAYAGHRIGANYALQGNILLGAAVLDSMQSRFLKTPGTLADKLMAALQGAKRPGADTRCLGEGVSAQSAFLRVSRPNDAAGKFYLDLQVPRRPTGKEPVDSLQRLYDKWKASVSVAAQVPAAPALRAARAGGALRLEAPGLAGASRWSVALYAVNGEKAWQAGAAPGTDGVTLLLPEGFPAGLYFVEVRAGDRRLRQKLFWD